MTCIVGIKTKENVFLASDGLSGSSSFKNISNNPKLLKLSVKSRAIEDKPLILGFTTSWRMGNLLRYMDNLEYIKNMPAEEWMVTKFVPVIKTLFKDGGFLAKEKDTSRDEGGTFLVGFLGKLFSVQDDFAVLSNTENYDACGAGAYYAFGSLHSTEQLVEILSEKRLTMALEAASHHNPFVSGPFHYMSLNNSEEIVKT